MSPVNSALFSFKPIIGDIKVSRLNQEKRIVATINKGSRFNSYKYSILP